MACLKFQIELNAKGLFRLRRNGNTLFYQVKFSGLLICQRLEMLLSVHDIPWYRSNTILELLLPSKCSVELQTSCCALQKLCVLCQVETGFLSETEVFRNRLSWSCGNDQFSILNITVVVSAVRCLISLVTLLLFLVLWFEPE